MNIIGFKIINVIKKDNAKWTTSESAKIIDHVIFNFIHEELECKTKHITNTVNLRTTNSKLIRNQ